MTLLVARVIVTLPAWSHRDEAGLSTKAIPFDVKRESAMAKRKIAGSLSMTQIDDLRAAILKRPPPVGDWVDMDHIFQIDRNLAKQFTALRLEVQSDVFRVLADGAAKAARLMK